MIAFGRLVIRSHFEEGGLHVDSRRIRSAASTGGRRVTIGIRGFLRGNWLTDSAAVAMSPPGAAGAQRADDSAMAQVASASALSQSRVEPLRRRECTFECAGLGSDRPDIGGGGHLPVSTRRERF